MVGLSLGLSLSLTNLCWVVDSKHCDHNDHSKTCRDWQLYPLLWCARWNHYLVYWDTALVGLWVLEHLVSTFVGMWALEPSVEMWALEPLFGMWVLEPLFGMWVFEPLFGMWVLEPDFGM